MTTIREALQAARSKLDPHSPSARLDAEVLLAYVLGVSRAWLIAEGQRDLTGAQSSAFNALITRRAAGEPVAYIVGHREFYGNEFVVDRRVLVPRPETELLIDLALGWAGRRSEQGPLLIADIGTGSGCIAITLALKLPSARVFAVDLSADALEVAKLNVERHGVGDRVLLLHGAGCVPLPSPVDLVASNPPYTRLEEVDANVRQWEPHLALDGGGSDGFDLPRQLLAETRSYLRPCGAVAMEIAAWQGELARATAQHLFPSANVTVHRDLAGLDRTLLIET
jgi:release factor glutamine methyltransferase